MSTHSSTAHARHADGKLSSIGDEISELKDTVTSSAQEAADRGRRVVRAAGAAAKDAASGLRDSAADARDRLGKTVQDNPFTSLAIAAGVGAALMGLFMLTRRK